MTAKEATKAIRECPAPKGLKWRFGDEWHGYERAFLVERALGNAIRLRVSVPTMHYEGGPLIRRRKARGDLVQFIRKADVRAWKRWRR